MGTRDDISQMFGTPKGVAVFGRVPGGVTADTVHAHFRHFGEDTPLYFVNPRGGTVGDIAVYTSATDIPGPVSLALIMVGTRHVVNAVEDCGKAGIPYAIAFSAGFSEIGPEGAAAERELAETCRRSGVRMIGPNTNWNAFEPLPEPPGHRGGKIGLITQSGHNGRPIVQGAVAGAAFSRWVPVGNEADLESGDFIDYFASDPDTAVIAAYIEGFRSPAKLRAGLRAANDADKPVIMLKMGSTQTGAQMAASHTGHLTGSDALIDGLFAQHAVTRVSDLDALLDTAHLFAKLPRGTGPRCALYSISGGSGTLMAEVAETYGVPVPALTDETQRALHELIPAYLTVSNPIDNGGSFLINEPSERRIRAMELIAADPNIDVVVIGLTGALGLMTDNFGADILNWAPRSPKPVVVTWNSYKTDEKGYADLVASGVPVLRSFTNCFSALRDADLYRRRSSQFRTRPDLADALTPEQAAFLTTSGALEGAAARTLLTSFGVPMVREDVATSREQAGELVAELGGPAVLKLSSPDLLHKSDAGLVVLGVADRAAAEATYDELTSKARDVNPQARIEGVVVQEMIAQNVEMIVGVSQDPVLGPGILVGTGGIFTEILGDVATRPLPLDADDVREMIDSLRGRSLLAGARGQEPVDIDALVQTVLAVARMAASCGPRLAEVDLNPVIVSSQGAIAVDSLVVIDAVS